MASTTRLLFRFDEKRATEVATKLLRLAGGRMEVVRLLKLLYMVDREGFKRRNRPVCGDSYAALEHGPILSTVYDLTKCATSKTPWGQTFLTKGISVELRNDGPPTPSETLSAEENEIVVDVHKQWEEVGTWKMVEILHSSLKEWQCPGKSSFPIDPRRILEALGRTEAEIEEIAQNVSAKNNMMRLLSL